jgi:hypothetical protein
MARKFEVTPSSDGTIKIVYGGEELVLVVQSAPSAPPPVSKRSPPQTPPKIVDPNQIYTFQITNRLESTNVETLVGLIKREYHDPSTATFGQVMLRSQVIDVHKIGKLLNQLGDELPNVGLHVDLHSGGKIM